MSQTIELVVPDIGGAENVDVIDVAVNVGDTVSVDDTLVTLETDKATMDVPAEQAGVVKEVKIAVGGKVSQGSVLVVIEAAGAAAEAAPAPVEAAKLAAEPVVAAPAAASGATEVVTEVVPDIGGSENVDVIDVAVKVGDTIALDDTLITLETDKATMDVPSTKAGVVKSVKINVGDKVSQGSVILTVEVTGTVAVAPVKVVDTSVAETRAKTDENNVKAKPAAAIDAPRPIESYGHSPINEEAFAKAHAGPSVRKLARELGVDLGRVKGSGHKNRVIAEDVKGFVKGVMQATESGSKVSAAGSLGGGLDLLPWPKVDFSKFGDIEVQPLSKIKRISGQNLSRNWAMIPHVTFNEDADMTELESFRKQMNKEWEREGIKISPLAFIIKASVEALKAFPEFNSSLDGDNLILKKYFNIGFAADTPNGLVVPVIKNVDKKGLKEISQELTELSLKAREGKLAITEMQGAGFTISSLGGIGGTSFTPIINAPEVAILGVCKSQIKPVWNGKEFEPRLMCPLSLSFDHRVIDGAAAARFTVYLAKLLGDIRRLVL